MTDNTRSRPNVLFIVMDTARYANVFSDPVAMPQLQEIALEGVRFEDAFANAPWTVPSHGSMFTGQYPSDHGAHAGNKQFDPEKPVIAELFRDAGYRTAAFSNNTWLSPEFGFDRGFDSFFVRWELFEGGVDLSAIAKADTLRGQFRAAADALASREVPLTLFNLLYAVYLRYQSESYDSGARRTNERLFDWLDDGDESFFGFVNYVEPHLPYEPPSEYVDAFLPADMEPGRLESVNQDPWAYLAGDLEMDDRDFDALEALYNAELRYLDDRIAEVYDRLDALGELNETMIVVVGDHGENLGDHGMMDHQYCLYDTLLHVPLVIRYPDKFTPGTEVNNTVELRDLFPTLLDAASVPTPEPASGVSQRSLVDSVGESDPTPAFAEYLAPQPSMDALRRKLDGALPKSMTHYDRALRAIRTDQWKLIEGSDGTVELYCLDPGDEMDDCSAANPEIVRQLRDRLEANRGTFTLSESSTPEMNRMTQQRLEDLGYIQ